jgi:hypothetical protein
MAINDFAYVLKHRPGDSKTLLEYADAIAIVRQAEE